MKKCILLLLFIASLNVGNAQIYVDVSAGGSNTGTSWANAYTDLQTAIDAAALNDDIWVAAGTYYPTASPDGTTTDSRNKAFHLGTDMKIYGGFAGTETQLSARNAAANITRLSGDFNNDDVVTGGGSSLSFSNNTENAYHVIITADLTVAAVIDGFTIKGGNANIYSTITYQSKAFYKSDGGGMLNNSSSPNITNSTFTNNSATENGGGGMYNSSSSPTITNSTFANNYAEYGGGMSNVLSSSPTITNSTFANNSADNGGGMYNSSSSPTITNSTFANNSADYHGGGMYNISSSPTITNSTFANNNAASRGGGMSNNSSSPNITNSTFTNNNANVDGGGMFNYNSSSPTITNTIIWDNGSSEVDNNSSSTPIFKNSIIKSSGGSGSWNTAYGTDNGSNLDTDPLFVDAANGDYRVQGCSPAIDAGDNPAWTNTGLSTDIAGNTRPFNSGIVDMGAYEYQGDGIAYVNKTATGNNDGSSWTDAFTDLQDAIDANCSSVDIWVAAGTYYPTASPDGTTTGPRDKAFHLGTDMKIYGGFAGGETQLSARNAAANITILSGDFDNDDIVTGGGSALSFSNNTENAYHVIITADLTAAAVIDGFMIKGGNANGGGSTISYQSGTFYKTHGGGMFNFSSSPTITNSTFTNNFANVDGGGMYNRSSSSPTITNSTFANNDAGSLGGGMFNFSSSPTITNSTFANNNADMDGGGMVNSSSSPNITNSTFANNNADYGGGMYNYNSSSPTITNSTFTNNNASDGGGMNNESSSPNITNSTFANNNASDGGGMSNSSSSPTITNSTFTNNNAASRGGGMSNYYSSPNITNSTFTNNNAGSGGGMDNYSSSSPIITNTIIWNNGSSEISNFNSTPIFKNSIIKSSGGSSSWNTAYGTDNGANLDTDPLFVDAANGDYRVHLGSPAINAGDDVSGSSANTTTLDLAGNPRFNGIIDIGAYESDGTVLPVELLYFDGYATENGNLLNWETASEENNKGFEIQRSANGENWETLDFVAGAGRTLENQTYDYLDEQPVNNANYYRLKQMDIDEAYEYSNIVLIDNQLPMDNSIFNIYPNPVSYELAVNSTDIIERVIIYNTLGQVVKEVIISDTQFSIDVSDLPEGIYTLQAQKANGQLVVKQFVK
jgi:hypothetical protein